METVLIFANPIAGRGQGAVMAAQLERRLMADGYDVRVFLEKASAIPEAQIPAGAWAAISIGGDGTLRTVADRISRLGPEAPPLLPVPLGTANLMGRHLGYQWDREKLDDEVSEVIRRRAVQPLDAGRANGRLFLLMAGVGFDGYLVHALDRLRTGPISILDYLLPAALALQNYEFRSLRVTVDDKEVWPWRSGLAFAGNVKEYGTGFPVLPYARPDDGLLDVCVLPCSTREELIRLFLQAAVGEHVLAEGAVYLKGTHVRIESDMPVPVQIDGDPGGMTPLDVDLLPFRLPFILP